MTARERAEEAIRKMNSMSPFDPTDEDVDFLFEAIRSAEAAAYERAAGVAKEYVGTDRIVERIRALATQGDER
jgi:hypothetical protein